MKFEEFKKTLLGNRTVGTGFVRSPINKKHLVGQIKFSFEKYEDLKKFITRFEKEIGSLKPLLLNSLLGSNSFPKSLENLNKEGQRFISDNIFYELNWQVIGFLKHFDKINLFIKLKNEFEHFLLSGNYESARVILDKIDKEISVSFWSIENRFILDEYEYGSEKNWETRKDILDGRNDYIVKAFGSIYSLKAEKAVSFFQYNDDMDSILDERVRSDGSKIGRLGEYMRFKGHYFSTGIYDDYTYIMFRESSSSLIDRYLMFIRICLHIIVSDSSNSEKILILFRDLNEVINDYSLRNTLFLYDGSISPNESESKLIKVLDLYTSGKYFEVVESVKNEILSGSANCMELYILYSKSLVELESEYSQLTLEESIGDDIAKCYYSVFNMQNNTDDCLIDLIKISYLFNNSYIGQNTYSFVVDQLGWRQEIDYSFLSALQSKFINPKLCPKIHLKKELSNSFLKRLINVYPDSITVKLYSRFMSNYYSNEVMDFDGTPKIKNLLYKVRNLIFTGNYEVCIEEYEKLKLSPSLSLIDKYEIVSNLYYAYIIKEQYREALILFTESFLFNSMLIKKMNQNSLVEGIVKGKFKNIGDKKSLIELPIFFKIGCEDKIRVKQAYELFLKANGLKKPTELIPIHDQFQKERLIYFLNDACVPEILQLSKSFDSTYSVNEERISILKFLTEVDSENINKYKIEISELTQKNTISKVIGNIDERKIFVNESKLIQKIRNTDKQNVLQNESISPLNSDSFERYIGLLNYIKNNHEFKDISSIMNFGDDGSMQLTEANHGTTTDSNEGAILYYPAFRIFLGFFQNIRDSFVFNKEFGLDAYLSTRIRHGTLPNHLRSVFETYSLVTPQTDDLYDENEYWKDKTSLNEEHYERLQNALRGFSKGVDDFSKAIKDQYIQCKSETRTTNEDGQLDFSYTSQELVNLFLNKFDSLDDIDEFIEVVLAELWYKAEQSLSLIRYAFNNGYRDVYISMIEILHQEVSSINGKESVSELLNSLMLCKTEIQNKMNNISKWFGRSDSSHDGEYKLEILAEASIEITKNIHPKYSFEIETKINNSIAIKGEYHQHFIDLINNCLFNIIKHSELDIDNLHAKLEVEEKEDRLVLKFSNRVENPNNHIDKLNKIKLNWQILDTNISEEGGTGFPKIKKIIFSDMNRKSSNFEFSFDNNLLNIILSFETKDL